MYAFCLGWAGEGNLALQCIYIHTLWTALGCGILFFLMAECGRGMSCYRQYPCLFKYNPVVMFIMDRSVQFSCGLSNIH